MVKISSFLTRTEKDFFAYRLRSALHVMTLASFCGMVSTWHLPRLRALTLRFKFGIMLKVNFYKSLFGANFCCNRHGFLLILTFNALIIPGVLFDLARPPLKRWLVDPESRNNFMVRSTKIKFTLDCFVVFTISNFFEKKAEWKIITARSLSKCSGVSCRSCFLDALFVTCLVAQEMLERFNFFKGYPTL